MNRLVTMTVGVFQPLRYVQDPTCPPCPKHGRQQMIEAIVCPTPEHQFPVFLCLVCHKDAKPGQGVYVYQPTETFQAIKELMEKQWLDKEAVSKYVN